ncbi:hypothetical protein GT030_16330 [Streptomyces sp. SID1328]|uniref:hypothetical protein n=1 Tax=Streptomyces sp. SID1328 TaxID=2690250 RepID=UPI00136C5D4C|nr:hypothetical protein [Streptomyces sp. SID1328]MYV40388.1 hypothetical protein [Streptomyces sp. SID1328]
MAGGVGADAALRIRRRKKAYIAAGLAAVLPPALELYEDVSRVVGLWWALGSVAVFSVLFGARQIREGAETGRVAAVRDEGLAAGEYTLTDYKVFLPFDRPKSSPERAESPLLLRLTNRGIQHWDGDTLRWSHPWAGLRLVFEDEVLLVHHEGRLVARFWVFIPFGTPDEILLAADRLQRHRPRR